MSGGRRPTHGARVRGLSVRTEDLERVDKRTRRQLTNMHSALAAEPIEAVRDALIGRIARKELLAQRAEAGLLAAADLALTVDGLGKFSTWLWNSLRRDAELLVLLEAKVGDDNASGTTCGRCGGRFGDLGAYLQHTGVCAQPTPPATDTDTAVDATDAAESSEGTV